MQAELVIQTALPEPEEPQRQVKVEEEILPTLASATVKKRKLKAYMKEWELPKMHPCTECPLMFPTAASLNLHTHSSQVFECGQCPVQTQSKESLAWHELFAHRRSSKKYTCELCQRQFWLESNL